MPRARIFVVGILAILFAPTESRAFVPPKLRVEPEIVGVYENQGTHPDGSTYEGVATIERLGPSRYSITFEVPNGVFRAICVRDRDLLGCGWGSSGLGVALYRARAGGLDGAWYREGDTSLGRERIAAATPEDEAGFDLEGVAPDGASYSGRFVGVKIGSVRRVSWIRDGATTWGWAIAQGDVLVAGFPSASCGAALYRISPDGRRLAATWMDFSRPDLGTSTETLVR
ncbi:MAG: hypothetical protein ACXVEF_21145 [Polyangiales bacterium]